MILVRVPLRITLAGGGTDQPAYADEFGGFAVTATLRQYMVIALNLRPPADTRYVVRYRETEHASEIGEVQHDLVRACLRRHPVAQAQITSECDWPADLGLGSSAAFTVGLLEALRIAGGDPCPPTSDIAEEAALVEIHDLLRPVGRQDPYACAFGGLCNFEFGKGAPSGGPLRVPLGTLGDLEDRLLLFHVPALRKQGVRLLHDQRQRTQERDPVMLANLHATKAIGQDIRDALRFGTIDRLGPLFDAHWAVKRDRTPGITTERLDAVYAGAKAHGAAGGKLLGAGGGGCFLFLADDPAALRAYLQGEQGLQEIPVAFDADGVTVLQS